MDAKEFAAAFNMSVSKLAIFTGYSRKTLYNVFEDDTGCNDKRIRAMIRQLMLKASRDRDNRKIAADRDYQKQMKLLEAVMIEKGG